MVRKQVADTINTLRDRRRSVRQELEAIFDRQTFVTILFLGPTGKAVELFLLGKPSVAARFALLALAGVGIGIYWKRLTDLTETVGDTVEETIDPDE